MSVSSSPDTDSILTYQRFATFLGIRPLSEPSQVGSQTWRSRSDDPTEPTFDDLVTSAGRLGASMRSHNWQRRRCHDVHRSQLPPSNTEHRLHVVLAPDVLSRARMDTNSNSGHPNMGFLRVRSRKYAAGRLHVATGGGYCARPSEHAITRNLSSSSSIIWTLALLAVPRIRTAVSPTMGILRPLFNMA
jgi:hypothetical protein